MNMLARLLGIRSGPGVELATAGGDNHAPARRHEQRSTPSSWDLMRGIGYGTDAGVFVAPHFAENLSAVFACVQIISETIATLPLVVYRRTGDGKSPSLDSPVARLFSRGPNSLQTPVEFLETMSAHCLLRGNAYAEIIRDNRGAPVELVPLHPGWVSVLRIPNTRTIVYDVSGPDGGTRRLLADEVLHLRDRSDDGIIGKSRLERAREAFATAGATELFAASTYRNGASLSGVLSHPDHLSDVAANRVAVSFRGSHAGSGNAGSIAVLEEGMKWTATSVAPADAQMLESRKFGVEQIARLYRVPPPVLGDLSHGTYSNVTELGRWFYQHTIVPWLTRWERTVERSLFSDEGRRTFEVEFDADVLTRANMLERYQSYRIAREIGLNSANELRAFENMNPRTDPGGDEFLAPMNMQSEQTRQPKDATNQ